MSELTEKLAALMKQYEPFRAEHEVYLADKEADVAACRKKYDPVKYKRNFEILDTTVKKYHAILGLVFNEPKRQGAPNAKDIRFIVEDEKGNAHVKADVIRSSPLGQAAINYGFYYQGPSEKSAVIAKANASEVTQIEFRILPRRDFEGLQLAMLYQASVYAKSVGKVLERWMVKNNQPQWVIEPGPQRYTEEPCIKNNIDVLVIGDASILPIVVRGFEKHDFKRDLQNACGQLQAAFGWIDLFPK